MHQKKKKLNEDNICYASSQNLPWLKFIFLLPRNCKNYENEFLQKENIILDWGHFAFSTESFRFRTEDYLVFRLKQAYSQPASECGLIEEKLSSEIVVLVQNDLMTPQS